MRKLAIALFAGSLIFSGCTRLYNSNEVDLYNTNRVLTYKTGVVEGVKKVVIKDDGSGTIAGIMSGTVIGGMFGKGKGNLLSTLIGGLTGALAGYELDKANGEELFIKLDNGEHIAVIVKGVNFKVGDKVRIIMNGNMVIRVEKI